MTHRSVSACQFGVEEIGVGLGIFIAKCLKVSVIGRGERMVFLENLNRITFLALSMNFMKWVIIH